VSDIIPPRHILRTQNSIILRTFSVPSRTRAHALSCRQDHAHVDLRLLHIDCLQVCPRSHTLLAGCQRPIHKLSGQRPGIAKVIRTRPTRRPVLSEVDHFTGPLLRILLKARERMDAGAKKRMILPKRNTTLVRDPAGQTRLRCEISCHRMKTQRPAWSRISGPRPSRGPIPVPIGVASAAYHTAGCSQPPTFHALAGHSAFCSAASKRFGRLIVARRPGPPFHNQCVWPHEPPLGAPVSHQNLTAFFS
jgi:hypothetical protein